MASPDALPDLAQHFFEQKTNDDASRCMLTLTLDACAAAEPRGRGENRLALALVMSAEMASASSFARGGAGTFRSIETSAACECEPTAPTARSALATLLGAISS